MPVSLYGVSCELDDLMAVGKQHDIPVINDAAEAWVDLPWQTNCLNC